MVIIIIVEGDQRRAHKGRDVMLCAIFCSIGAVIVVVLVLIFVYIYIKTEPAAKPVEMDYTKM